MNIWVIEEYDEKMQAYLPESWATTRDLARDAAKKLKKKTRVAKYERVGRG